MSKVLKAVFPALHLNEESIHKRLGKVWIWALLFYIVLVAAFILYIFHKDNSDAGLVNYLISFVFIVIVSTVQCFGSSILSSFFDGVFFKKGLTITEIIRVMFPYNLVYAYLYFLRSLIGLNLRTVYVVTVAVWFCINYFIAQRRAFRYNYFQAAATGVIYLIIIGCYLESHLGTSDCRIIIK